MIRPSRPPSPKLCSTAQTLEASLRLRLFIGPSAPELHSLRWETLRDPQDSSALLTSERVLFSRYLSSMDWRPVRLRPKADLRALVVGRHPSDVANYQPGGRPLAALDVAGELTRAKEGLGSIATTDLTSGGKATFNNLSGHLREGYDILFLICHGAVLAGEAQLWFEDGTGQTQRLADRNSSTGW